MAMNKKWTNEFFDQELKKIKPFWKRIGNIINGKETVDVLCENNHLKKIQPARIHKKEPTCQQCNLEVIRFENGDKFIEELSKNNYTPLFTTNDYVNSKTVMNTLCPNNTLFTTSQMDFTSKYRYKKRCRCILCLKSTPKPKKPYVRTRIETFNELIIKGFKMDDDQEYKGLKYEINGCWIECGHRVKVKPETIIYKDVKCKKCRIWTIEKFQIFLDENTNGYKVNFEQDFHMKKPINIICTSSHEFTAYPQNMIYYDYRCPNCTNENKSGENSQFFNEELSEEERQARTQKYYKRWMRSVKKRDKNICQLCCNTNNIVAHHYYSFREYENIRFDKDNGVTLCQECHRDFHDKFGYNGNNIDQFIEYCSQMKINELLITHFSTIKEILQKKIQG